MDSNASRSRLTGVISGKLSLAASEILADVEMTFALYEVEVSGLKQEINRLKSQLELLQPRVKEEPTDDQMLFSLCGADGGDGWRDDAGQTGEIKSENQTMKIVSYTGGLTEDQPIQGPDEASRLTDRNLENYVDLKICILTDWTIQEVSDQVDDQYPVHELQCRSGQQEADFLKLLRSTFPLLGPSTPFESFITDPTNRLQPLELQAFTPEQICRAAGNSALYIRLKCPVEQEAGSRQQPMQTSDDDFDYEDAPPMELQTAPDANRNETLQEKPVENQRGRNEDIVLKVRIIEDVRIVALSKTVLKKYKSEKLRCPCGMQEAEFLKLLKSTFPQLAAGAPFEYLITNNTRKLLPLKVESLTPEQISGAAGNSALFIRLKSVEGNIKSRLKDLLTEASRKKTESQNKCQLKETDTHINLRIHVLEDSSIKVVTSEVLRKYRLNKLECPRGMQEVDFLKLLRSTFPKLTLFESFKCDRNGTLLPLHLRSFTPELICSAAGTSALYIRLQHPEKPSNRTEETQQDNQDGEHPPHPPPPHPAPPSNRNENPADDKDSHFNLNVCYLQESQMDLFSSQEGDPSTFNPQLLFKKFPVHVLTCPRELQQSDLLAFLRSTFSQLASDQPFSVFVLQGQKMLQLNLNSSNPEEIRATVDSLEASVICVQQLKDPTQKEADESKDPRPRTPQASIQEPSRMTSDPEDLVELKLCIVADPEIDVASPLVLQKYPILEFQCPGTLQEAEFLSLLQTTFPQLAGEALDFLTGHSGDVKPINLQNLTSDDISRTLKSAGGSLLYVRLKEHRSVQTGVKRSHSDVSPTRKNGKKRKRSKSQSSTAALSEDETEDSEDDGQNNVKSKVSGLENFMPKCSAASSPVEKTDKHPDPTPNTQTDDEQTDDSEDENYYNNPLVCKLSLPVLQPGTSGQSSEQDIKTEPADPTGQKHSGEAANSQADDEETEDSEDYDERESLPSSRLSSFRPRRPEDEMEQNTSKTRVKTKKKKKEKKKEKNKKKKGKKKGVKLADGSTNLRIEEVEIVDSEDGDDKNTESTRVTSLQPRTSGKDAKRQTRTGEVKKAKKKKVKKSKVSLNKETNCKKEEVEIIDIEDDDGNEASSQPQVSGPDAKQQKSKTEDRNEVERAAVTTINNMEAVEIIDSDNGDGDKDSKSQISGKDSQQTDTETRKVLENKTPGPSAANTNSSLPPSNPVYLHLYRCEVCQTYHQSKRILIKHVWSHVNNQSFLCGVCRQRFDSTASLKTHLHTHRKTYTCKVCGKFFLSKAGFKGHMERHQGGAPEQK